MAEDLSAYGFVKELLNIAGFVCFDAALDANPWCYLAVLSDYFGCVRLRTKNFRTAASMQIPFFWWI
jgi:hypothetical protein